MRLVVVWLHVVAAAAWVGGLLYTSHLIAPAAARGGRESLELLVRGRAIAWGALAILVLTGLENLRSVGLEQPLAGGQAGGRHRAPGARGAPGLRGAAARRPGGRGGRRARGGAVGRAGARPRPPPAGPGDGVPRRRGRAGTLAQSAPWKNADQLVGAAVGGGRQLLAQQIAARGHQVLELDRLVALVAPETAHRLPEDLRP